MTNALQIMKNKLESKEVTTKLITALGLNPSDEKSQQEAFRYASSALSEIAKTAGDSKKDLTVCNPDSIVRVLVDAASMKIMIDGRQHAHIVKFGNNAQLQIGYRGYVAKIKETYPDAEFVVEPVFKGDDLKIWDESGVQQYTLKKQNPFATGQDALEGILVAITYTDNGRLVRKVTPVPKERIDRARKAAKQDFIWTSDYMEKAKAAAIKNACKIHFAAITALQDVVNYDNQENFDVNKQDEASPTRSSIIDNINQSVLNEESVIEAEIVENAIDIDALEKSGLTAASSGVESYKAWLASLSADEKETIKDKHKEWSAIAKNADTPLEADL